MEKMKTQRIVGVLAVAALVIIALPLFGKSDLSTPAATTDTAIGAQASAADATEITPAMANEMSDASSSETYANQLISDKPVPVETDKPKLTPPLLKKASEDLNNTQMTKTPQLQPQSVAVNHEQAPNLTQKPKLQAGVPEEVQAQTTSVIEPGLTPTETSTVAVKKAVMAEAVHEVPAKAKTSAKSHVASSKKSGWAIQMGSFKVKANAEHLVSKLRAKGYHAFAREITTAKSTQTRVYIGPELKQSSAHDISIKVASEFNLKGLVINYKPLA